MDSRGELVKMYFQLGFPYKIILRFLKGLYGVALSLRTLKRLLQKMGLQRRGVRSSFELVADCMEVRSRLGNLKSNSL